jgi:hypothetical protein
VKQIPPWASLPDSNRPLRSEPPVWKVEKHREMTKRLEKSLLKAPETGPPPADDSATTDSDAAGFENRTLLLVLWLGAAAMLVSAAVGRHPYSFYILLRWVCCAVFAYSALAAYEKNRLLWSWIFGALAVLYNPIFRVHLDRTTWTGVNWFTVGMIIVAALVFWRRTKSPERAAAKESDGSSNRSKAASKRPNIADILGITAGVALILVVIAFASSRRPVETSQTAAPLQSAQTEPEIRKAIPVYPNEPEIRRALPVDETERIRKLAEETITALAAGNYQRVADLTYPKLVEMAGGRDKVIEALRGESENLKAHGGAVLGAEVSEPSKVVTVGDKQFAIVPMVMRVQGPKGSLRANGFLIGISSDRRSTWTFIDGTQVTKEKLAQLVPDFPTQLSLPTPPEHPVVEVK